VDLGFSKDRVALVDIEMKDSVKKNRADVVATQLLDLVRGIPTVQSAGISMQGLIGGNFAWVERLGIRFPGRELETVKPRYLAISTGFFDTMQIHLLDGRDFTARDMTP
jgi:hypothetical protein